MSSQILSERIGTYTPTEADKERYKARLEYLSSKDRKIEPRSIGCFDDSVCGGEDLMNNHVNRVSWWLTAILTVIALIVVIVLGAMMNSSSATPGSSWSYLNASGWIQPTPNSLAALIGMAMILDVYVGYMQALRKGHLDHSVGQYVLRTVIHIGLWLLILYGIGHYGYIGSMFGLLVLGVSLLWQAFTSHGCAPFYTWVSMVELAFVVFLTIWLGTAQVKIWP